MKIEWQILVCACLALTSVADARALADLPKDAIQVDEVRLASARRSAFTRDELLKLGTETSQQALVQRVSELCASSNPLLSETSLSMWLDNVVDAKRIGPRDQAALKVLSRCQSRVYVLHEESAGQWWLPAFPLSTRAQSMLSTESLRAEADQLAHEWTHSRLDTARRSVDARTAAFAVDVLDAAAVEKLAIQATSLPAAALVPLARRQYSPSLFAEIRARSDSESLVRDLPKLVSMVPLADRLTWLQALATRPELASVAISAAGSLDTPPMRAWLMRLLDQPGQGASAAQALALKISAEQWARIATDDSQSRPRRLHALLALRLRGDSEARLAELAASGALPSDLASELQR